MIRKKCLCGLALPEVAEHQCPALGVRETRIHTHTLGWLRKEEESEKQHKKKGAKGVEKRWTVTRESVCRVGQKGGKRRKEINEDNDESLRGRASSGHRELDIGAQ